MDSHATGHRQQELLVLVDAPLGADEASFGLPFHDEVMLRFDFSEPGSQCSAAAEALQALAHRAGAGAHRAGRLRHLGQRWPSPSAWPICIAPRTAIWPQDGQASVRRARSLCRQHAQRLHGDLRRLVPHEHRLPNCPSCRAEVCSPTHPGLSADLARAWKRIWDARTGSPWRPLCSSAARFCAADAYLRPRGHAHHCASACRYRHAARPTFKWARFARPMKLRVYAWVAGRPGLEKCNVVPEDEPYRSCASEAPR